MQPGRAASGLLTAAALLAACGDSMTRTADQERNPSPPILTALPGMAFSAGPGAAARLDFDVPQRGDLVATIDWQDPANNLVAVFTDTGCHSINDALGRRCVTAAVSDFPSTCPAKPRVLVHSNYAPVALRLWIANMGATAESGSVALTHCTDGPDCGATASCGQCTLATLPKRSCAP